MEEIEKRGPTKDNLKRLFSFDKRDIIWLFFFLFLFLGVWGYTKDMESCRSVVLNPDFQECMMHVRIEAIAGQLEEIYPNSQVNCDPRTGQCLVSGVPNLGGIPDFMEGLNLTIILNETR